jgi:hypothetical protein
MSDGVADAILKCANIAGADVRRNKNVGGDSVLKRVCQSWGAGGVGGGDFRPALGEGLQVFCVFPHDAYSLAAQ